MDDLDRIERLYGSVAEYNRSRYEDEAHRYYESLSDSEKDWLAIESNIEQDCSSMIADALSLEASAKTVAVVNDYNDKVAAFGDKRDYNIWKSIAQYKHDASNEIAGQYGLKFLDERPELGQGQFSVSYEYNDFGMIKSKYSEPMDKDTFFHMYTDMCELNRFGYSMTVSYRDTSGREPDNFGFDRDRHFICNSTLSSIRRFDFKMWDVEDKEGADIIKNIKQDYAAIKECVKAEFEQDHREDSAYDRLKREKEKMNKRSSQQSQNGFQKED